MLRSCFPVTELDQVLIRQRFNRVAAQYDTFAQVQQEIGQRLLERLELISLQPQQVLDLGCGTGCLLKDLFSRYKKAHIMGIDRAEHMLQQARYKVGHKERWWRKPQWLTADTMHLPLQADSVDMILSNLMLHWCEDVSAVFAEVVRVLRPQGLFLFTTLGADTLKELRQSWQQVDQQAHVHTFMDMHDIGDALLVAGFRDPVMDMEMISLTYRDLQGLWRDLKQTGAQNALHARQRGLMGKQRWRAMCQAYADLRWPEGEYPVTLEVVYGHAWAPSMVTEGKPERYIPLRPA